MDTDPRLRLLMALVLTATLFGALEAIREGGSRLPAVLVTLGLAVSMLLRVLPPLRRDVRTQQRHPHCWTTVLGLVLFAVVIAMIVTNP
ncbi:hypothetical protein [Streptomyces sp. NPDC002205]|uniref:hypothetical protein n=1 Tax=Streptomyces sp. NPDC002205 TaxID=3154411 RepID=UPI00331C038C